MSNKQFIADTKLIDALMSCRTITEAAKVAGCSRSTVYNRLDDCLFQIRLNSAIDERRMAVTALGSSVAEKAAETLMELLSSPGVSDATRLQAAQTALKVFW